MTEAEGEQERRLNFWPSACRQVSDQATDLPSRDRLDVVQVDRAASRETVVFIQGDLGGDVSNRGCDRSDRHFTQKLERGRAGENQHRPLLVWPGESVPPNVAAIH